MPPWFSVARLSLLDRGFVWALVHPRGGGELGRQWYLDGKLESKVNTFTDTIACVEHLSEARIVAPGRVCIRGGSAGGLLELRGNRFVRTTPARGAGPCPRIPAANSPADYPWGVSILRSSRPSSHTRGIPDR